ELCQKEGIEGVAGNYDEAVAFSRLVCGCGYADPEVARIGHLSLTWTQERVNSKTKEILANLPKHLEFKTPIGKSLAFHGGLEDLTQWITEKDTDILKDIVFKTKARLVLLGHIHKPFVTEIEGTTFINPGAVGRPFDGNPWASFAVADIGKTVYVRLKRVEYDIEKNIRELIAAGLPAEIGIMLRTGKDTHLA
ncbi:MAG: metallophosphatase family protein, partial [Syntrophales bacterium LBB04]|nr:metallophosphatase family protein [Syntrophales bacterium LBB04]